MDPILARVIHAAQAALDKKAESLDILHVESLTSIADYFVLCSAANERPTPAGGFSSTTATSSFMCSPKTPGASTGWSGCGETRRMSPRNY
jgi:hypothetical protein